MALSRSSPVLGIVLALVFAGQARAQPSSSPHGSLPSRPYFRITVVDQETHRGIPCVKLQMLNCAQYWTDSAGVVAFYEPDLMNQRVWFTVESHGYRNDNAPMGFNGVVLDIVPGGSAVVPMRRINIAQRLYRMTGSGMYRDSLLLGDPVPPLFEEGKPPMMGQDGSDVVIFRGKFHWLWGDTLIPRFPLGVYQGTCAVSDLPDRGGLDPDKGVALRYFRKDDGEPRPIIHLPLKPGSPYWYTRPRVVRDDQGNEHFMTNYTNVGDAMKVVGRGVVEFSEQTGLFEPVATFDSEHPVFQTEGGGTTVFVHEAGGKEYFYEPGPYPGVRYPTDCAAQADMRTREAFTCLKPGSRFDGTVGQIERDENGSLRWGWKNPIRFNPFGDSRRNLWW